MQRASPLTAGPSQRADGRGAQPPPPASLIVKNAHVPLGFPGSDITWLPTHFPPRQISEVQPAFDEQPASKPTAGWQVGEVPLFGSEQNSGGEPLPRYVHSSLVFVFWQGVLSPRSGAQMRAGPASAPPSPASGVPVPGTTAQYAPATH